MKLTSENLIIVSRNHPSDDTPEVLVGRKKRGRFENYSVFPGGKAEGTALQPKEAARELYEESGIDIPSHTLRHLGSLLVWDMRPGIERFGNVFLFGTEVNPALEAIETEELNPEWRPKDDPSFTDDMPPDVQYWWPTIKDADIHTAPIAVHLTYNETGKLDIIVKEPNFAHTAGKILRTAVLSPLE